MCKQNNHPLREIYPKLKNIQLNLEHKRHSGQTFLPSFLKIVSSIDVFLDIIYIALQF